MYKYEPDLTSQLMVENAYKSLKNYLEIDETLDDDTRDCRVNRMEEMLENYLLEFGLGWIPSKNLIYRFKEIDLKNQLFDFNNPMTFDDFIAESLSMLQYLFGPRTLKEYIRNSKSANTEKQHFMKAVLYKAWFGLTIFEAMPQICYRITESKDPVNKSQYILDSVRYNTWWNSVVNYERFAYITTKDDGSEEQKEIYIKPTIAVDPNRDFYITNCKLVIYH